MKSLPLGRNHPQIGAKVNLALELLPENFEVDPAAGN